MRLVEIAPGHLLDAPAAAAFLRAAAAGCPVAITSSYRTPATQARWRATYLAKRAAGLRPTYVAPVALSEHVTGQALDLKDPAIAWMRAHPGYGFVFTDPTERWHAAYRLAHDEHLADVATPAPPAPAAPHPQEDDTMKPLFVRRKDGAIAIVSGNGARILTAVAWQVWTNLGYSLTPGLDNLDPGPFDVVIDGLGGWAK